jgi:hypothetical protein
MRRERPAKRESAEAFVRASMVRAAERADADAARAHLRAAERQLVWFYTSAAAAIGFRAQRYDVAGGSVYHGGDIESHACDEDHGARFALWDTRAPGVLDQLARLDVRHRFAVDRHTEIRARLDEVSLRDERTFELAYRDPHQARGTMRDPERWTHLRNVFRRRATILEDQVLDAKGRPRWETRDGGRIRKMVQTQHTTVTLLGLVADTHEVRLGHAQLSGALGGSLAERMEFLDRVVTLAATVTEAALFLTDAHRAAGERLDQALERFSP